MSIAWSTILIIVLLLPGIFFLGGFATRERISREFVRTSAVGEIGLALLVAIVIHYAAWHVLGWSGFEPVPFFEALLDLPDIAPARLIVRIEEWLLYAAWYVFATSASGMFTGYMLAAVVTSGWLRFLVKHKWAYDLTKDKSRFITTYIMSSTQSNGMQLMYSGRLHDFHLTSEGRLAYVILKDCSRFYMRLSESGPITTSRTSLFADEYAHRTWNYLVIDGKCIENALFEKSAEVTFTNEEYMELMEQLENRFNESGIEADPDSNRAASSGDGNS